MRTWHARCPHGLNSNPQPTVYKAAAPATKLPGSQMNRLRVQTIPARVCYLIIYVYNSAHAFGAFVLSLKDIIRVADGKEKADRLLTNAEITNVFSGAILIR